MSDTTVKLSDLDLGELEKWLSDNDIGQTGRQAERQAGRRSFRGGQIYRWLGLGVPSFGEMTNIPLELRAALAARASTGLPEILAAARSERDGTVKYAMKTDDGNIIESVLMRYRHGDTVCLSSQAGCRMGCAFCATKPRNFSRSLSPGEIFGQAAAIAWRESRGGAAPATGGGKTGGGKTGGGKTGENDDAAPAASGGYIGGGAEPAIGGAKNISRIGNIVVMGVGEPFDNYDATLKSLKLLHGREALDIGYRKMTVSTCGIVPGILRLAGEGLPIGLSVSLHSADDKIRSSLMPVNNRYSIDKLIEGCKIYTYKTNRRVTFEYALIKDVNDAPDDAKRLMRKIRGMLCHINLIPVNETGNSAFAPSPAARVRQFGDLLLGGGFQATVRRGLGTDILAACGQLRNSMIDR